MILNSQTNIVRIFKLVEAVGIVNEKTDPLDEFLPDI